MTRIPEPAELRAALERALGFALSEFRPLKGGSSPNFKAVRAEDGLPFLVKLLPPERAWSVPALLAHLEEMRGTRCVQRVFPDAPETVAGLRLVCLEWCEGSVKMPYQLSAGELGELAAFYGEFSEALQRVRDVAPPDPAAHWLARILACRGLVAAPIRRLVRRVIGSDDLAYRPDRLRVIFGDFHHGNILFREGRVHRVLDLESFCRGYPTQDFVRYFTCAYDHLKWRAPFRRRAMLAAFGKLLGLLPYSRQEWTLAVNAAILCRLQDLADSPRNPFLVVNLLFRVRFYLALKRLVRACPLRCWAAAALLGLAACGCTFHREVVNERFRDLETAWIEPGVTTRAQVVDRLGYPPTVREGGGISPDAFHWVSRDSFTGRLEVGYIVTPTFERAREHAAEDILIRFDSKGVVTLVSRTRFDGKDLKVVEWREGR